MYGYRHAKHDKACTLLGIVSSLASSSACQMGFEVTQAKTLHTLNLGVIVAGYVCTNGQKAAFTSADIVGILAAFLVWVSIIHWQFRA